MTSATQITESKKGNGGRLAQLGSTVLFLALALSVYSSASSLLGARYKRPRLIESGMYATYLLPVILLIAVLVLIAAFIAHEFNIAYVADHSNRAMRSQYTWVAFYSGNEGSLLYIAFSLSAIGALALYKSPAAIKEAVPYINIVVMMVLMFFLAIMAFLAIIPAMAMARMMNNLAPHRGGQRQQPRTLQAKTL